MSLAQSVTDETASNKISITNVVGHSYLIVSGIHRSVYMRDRGSICTQKIKEMLSSPVAIPPSPTRIEEFRELVFLRPESGGTKGFPCWFAPA